MKCADVEYDSGYGAAEVAPDLKLIGEDFWLERAEYDGSEWREYKTIPEFEHLPEKTVKRVLGGMWESLSELQDDEWGDRLYDTELTIKNITYTNGETRTDGRYPLRIGSKVKLAYYLTNGACIHNKWKLT